MRDAADSVIPRSVNGASAGQQSVEGSSLLTAESAPPSPREREPSTGPPLLSSRRLRLRPAGPDDGAILYDLLLELGFTALPILPLWIADGTAFKNAAAQFVVEQISDRQVAGYTSLHELDLNAGHVQVGVYSTPQAAAPGLGAEASILTVDYAFAMWSIKKVYCHTTDANLKYFGGTVAKIVRREAVLRDHKYFRGRLWDVHIFAIHREDWLRTGSPLAQRLARLSDDPPVPAVV